MHSLLPSGMPKTSCVLQSMQGSGTSPTKKSVATATGIPGPVATVRCPGPTVTSVTLMRGPHWKLLKGGRGTCPWACPTPASPNPKTAIQRATLVFNKDIRPPGTWPVPDEGDSPSARTAPLRLQPYFLVIPHRQILAFPRQRKPSGNDRGCEDPRENPRVHR